MKPIAPTPEVESIRKAKPMDPLISRLWTICEPKLEQLLRSGKSVDQVCTALEQHASAHAMALVNDTPGAKASLVQVRSYQGASGAFMISLGYNCRPRKITNDILIIFKMNPGICRRCGCTADDCEDCVVRTGEPCHWVEHDLCSACA